MGGVGPPIPRPAPLICHGPDPRWTQ
jgi:hypothetical protein